MRATIERALDARSLGRWGLGEDLLRHAANGECLDYGRFLHSLVDGYSTCVDKSSYELWVDHTPKNVRHLQALLTLFPDSKAIHIVRDGRGVAASVMSLDWGPNTVIAAAHWWVHHLAFGLAAESYYGNERVFRVRYEDLVSRPQVELSRICAWLDLEYVDEMSRGGGFEFAQGLFRYHSLIHDAPEASRATAWKDSLSEREIRTFESRTNDLLPYLGYELLFQETKTALIERLRTLLLEPLLIAVNAGRFRYWRAKKERMLARSSSNETRNA
jgi:hypothetical protein